MILAIELDKSHFEPKLVKRFHSRASEASPLAGFSNEMHWIFCFSLSITFLLFVMLGVVHKETNASRPGQARVSIRLRNCCRLFASLLFVVLGVLGPFKQQSNGPFIEIGCAALICLASMVLEEYGRLRVIPLGNSPTHNSSTQNG
jgi:hypothetical protein